MSIAAAFQPECLTLFPSVRCDLACRYCHASPSARGGAVLSDAVVADATDIVAASCTARAVPMTLVLLGGGEPLTDAADAERLLGIVRTHAEKNGVALRTYVGTNGVLAEETARWLAREFDLVGLSCDGPPEVQDRQRPLRDGGRTSPAVERTARVLRESGTPFHLRATVTRETIGRQREVVEYAAALGAAEVRLEPAYRNPRGDGLRAEDAEAFVAAFEDARRGGIALGVPVTTSLLRPDEPHGPNCNVLRGVVNLAPGDFATACFMVSREADARERGVLVGGVGADGRFRLDEAVIARIAETCGRVPDECADCALAHACSRGCPDVCALDGDTSVLLHDTFRCRAQRLLAGEVVCA